LPQTFDISSFSVFFESFYMQHHLTSAARDLLRSLPPASNSTITMFSSSVSGRFIEAVIKSIGVIGASEIGDKTFFIAAVMAMRNSRLTVSCSGGDLVDTASATPGHGA
jgi:hypothetical protein